MRIIWGDNAPSIFSDRRLKYLIAVIEKDNQHQSRVARMSPNSIYSSETIEYFGRWRKVQVKSVYGVWIANQPDSIYATATHERWSVRCVEW